VGMQEFLFGCVFASMHRDSRDMSGMVIWHSTFQQPKRSMEQFPTQAVDNSCLSPWDLPLTSSDNVSVPIKLNLNRSEGCQCF